MGTLHHRPPRPASDRRLTRVATDARVAVAVVELRDEKRSNTISHQLAEDVIAAAALIRRHGAIRALALCGEGEHFSVGVNPYNYCADANDDPDTVQGHSSSQGDRREY